MLKLGTDPAGTGLPPGGDGRMWLDDDFREQLQHADLAAFERVMASVRGRCLRVLADRENWYFSAQVTHGSGMYLKKHHVRARFEWLWERLGLACGENPGRSEARHAAALSALGVNVMRVVAYGERRRADGLAQSFLLTEELKDFVELGTFVRERFSPRRPGRRTAADRELERLVCQVAAMARRFHAAGYNHRDFYCCHFLVREENGDFQVRLIDLQRVQRRRWLRWRWIVKDLAQLAWSAPGDRLGCRHKILFLRHYLGVEKLRRGDRRLLRAILRRCRNLQRRLGNGS
ncbi:MAG: lipopolysaccharide kinase InaA family protein [Thermoguttaceae bacterium]|jgi:heptose I phosphotransferase